MKRIAFVISTMLIAGKVSMEAQSLGDQIRTPDKSVPVIHQTLTGAWIYEYRRGGQAATQPATLALLTFYADGSVLATTGGSRQNSDHGIWLRTGDRKFLQTMFTFSVNESGALTGIIKVRINAQLSADGQTVKGTQEVVLMDRDGRVMATIPGGTFTGSRLTPEIPGDFYEFQNQP